MATVISTTNNWKTSLEKIAIKARNKSIKTEQFELDKITTDENSFKPNMSAKSELDAFFSKVERLKNGIISNKIFRSLIIAATSKKIEDLNPNKHIPIGKISKLISSCELLDSEHGEILPEDKIKSFTQKLTQNPEYIIEAKDLNLGLTNHERIIETKNDASSQTEKQNFSEVHTDFLDANLSVLEPTNE